MGPQGLLVLGLPVPVVLHSPSLGPATATRVLSTQVPVSAPPPGLDECLFFISLVSDPLAVRILCQFWLREEAQCVYLHRHLGSSTGFPDFFIGDGQKYLPLMADQPKSSQLLFLAYWFTNFCS